MRTATAAIVLLLTGVGDRSFAQPQPRVPLTILQKTELSTPWLEAVTTMADFVPGATVGLHTHPGEMIGYMVTGSVVLEEPGKPAVTLAAGQAFTVAEGVAHNFTNAQRMPARMFATYIVEKEQPLTMPVRGR